ncbi:hypothetical protein MMC28_009427 [Mycoblastus sanguinarius]|nr:hypothetical protein [Mycoblastus sanguinarius]
MLMSTTSSTTSKPVEDRDINSESLPSTLDFSVMPRDDYHIGSATLPLFSFNTRAISTRASSFDSAAPPPIGLGKRAPPNLTEEALGSTMRKSRLSWASSIHNEAAPAGTRRISRSSLMFFRPTPKAVLYSHTTPRKPPVSASLSRTGLPSIPALFSKRYRGQFPPAQQTEQKDRRPAALPEVRGRSAPPKAAPQRRRSWFRTDQIENVFGGREIQRKEIEHILKPNQFV